ncbi:hypothetical protein C8Q79DRAFT_37630 [Trametes meyenii]|nr:hypothetical protein C8Q79DRAFT_37630 [Trametes meyenii]
MPASSEALRPKAEGNELFIKKDFSAAYKKYTQAIGLDGSNAILYSNRAACSLGRGRYLDAQTDAQRATELDASYAKAWARLAAACVGLDQVEQAVTTWKRALDALPSKNLTATEQKQKEQYTSELRAATARLQDTKSRTLRPTQLAPVGEEDQPWTRAYVIVKGLMPSNTWNSSAWVIACAHLDWRTGVEMMNQLKKSPASVGVNYFGRRGAIERMSNGLLADPRVFSITQSDFFDKYNEQVMFESKSVGAWPHGSSRTVIEEAPQRLAIGSWNAVRPALSLTIRGWVLRAFAHNLILNSVEAALDLYSAALEVLHWGNEVWKDASFEDKGAIFQDTFIRGIKCLRLNAFMEAYLAHRGPTSKYPLSEILAGAEDLINELASEPEAPSDVQESGFYLSFVRYPLAQAHSLRGFYHQHTARNARHAGRPASEVAEHWRLATHSYILSAELYPVDDEKHPVTLHWAVQCFLEAGASAQELIALLNRMHDVIPAIKHIWEFSADSVAGRNVVLKEDILFRDSILKGLAEGKLAPDSVVPRGFGAP